MTARKSQLDFPTNKSSAKKRRQVDFLDISKEDFGKYETLDLEGKPAKPSKHNIFRDSLVGDRGEAHKLFIEKLPSLSLD